MELEKGKLYKYAQVDHINSPDWGKYVYKFIGNINVFEAVVDISIQYRHSTSPDFYPKGTRLHLTIEYMVPAVERKSHLPWWL